MSRTYKTPDYVYSSFQDEEWQLKQNKKRHYRPNKKFKNAQKQTRKAKEKQAIKTEDWENIPEFKKSDEWEWL